MISKIVSCLHLKTGERPRFDSSNIFSVWVESITYSSTSFLLRKKAEFQPLDSSRSSWNFRYIRSHRKKVHLFTQIWNTHQTIWRWDKNPTTWWVFVAKTLVVTQAELAKVVKRPPVWPSSLAKIATKSVGKVLWPFVGEFFALFESLDLGEVEPKRSCFEVWTCSRNDLQVEMMSKFTKRFAEIYAKMICLNVKIEPRRILFLQTSLRIISLGRRFSILMYIVVISFPKKSVLRAKRKADFELLLCFFYFYFENLTWIQKKNVLEPWPGSICHRGTWKLETNIAKETREKKNASHPKGFERCQHATKVNEPHGFDFVLFSSENPDSILWLQHLTQSSSIVCWFREVHWGNKLWLVM